jgi:hypothetical protein
MKALKNLMSFLAAAVLATAVNLHADDKTAANPFFASLSTATAAELPAKAAEMVSQADKKNLKQTTIDVVKAAVGLNPAAAPAIVGSIAQSSPAMAATAAEAAVSVLPNHAVAIASAAAAAAPSKAGQIVEAVCRELPASYREVAEAVAEVVPGAGREILTGIASAMPELKDLIKQVTDGYDGKIPSVTTVLDQVAQANNSADPTLSPANTAVSLPPANTTVSPSPVTIISGKPQAITIAPPTVPISGTPQTLDPGTGGEVPTGGRYAAP